MTWYLTFYIAFFKIGIQWDVFFFCIYIYNMQKKHILCVQYEVNYVEII